MDFVRHAVFFLCCDIGFQLPVGIHIAKNNFDHPTVKQVLLFRHSGPRAAEQQSLWKCRLPDVNALKFRLSVSSVHRMPAGLGALQSLRGGAPVRRGLLFPYSVDLPPLHAALRVVFDQNAASRRNGSAQGLNQRFHHPVRVGHGEEI
ncbi:hypothetical protein SDC9_132712 [bioreactor metagenome]|uniref:Uncharacterized protein n=1 Tax=bioreactor metagenome TaxID=1076179 RepID=A0A645D8P4_9ZZZZ